MTPPTRSGAALPEPPAPLPQPVVDTHCHLDMAEEFSGLGAEQALHQAAAVGVTRIVQIGCDVPSSRWAVAAAARWPAVVAGVALHPNDAARMSSTQLAEALTEIERLARAPGVRAVGETGLDFYRTRNAAGHQVQRESFAAHIAMANTYHRTLVIHDRDAHAEILEILDSGPAPRRIVMHCFSGAADFAMECLARGAYLSFAGNLTYKANEHLREALMAAPLERILVETDAPFLTPLPHRGRSNASYLIPHTARAMAELREVDLDRLCRALTANAYAAFGGSWGRAED